MTEATSVGGEYTMGYSPEFLQLLDRRNAQANAGYLLPHLGAGFRVLDFGCGPGTITIGLAQAVHPGEVHGIDMEASQIELARAAAADGGHDNATFHMGNVYELPFEDASFDVAHCHAVLMHVPDTERALREVRRVLKPGGMIASREMIGSCSFNAPMGETTAEAWSTFLRMLVANGGHPEMGKELKSHLLRAGFSDIRASGSFDYFSSAADVEFLHAFIIEWFFAPNVVAAATRYGLATREQFDRWRIEIDQWKDEPGAVGGLAFGEATGIKPAA